MKLIQKLQEIESKAITYEKSKSYGNKGLYYVECKFPYKEFTYVSFENDTIGFSDAAHAVKFENLVVADSLVNILKDIFATVCPEAVFYSKYYQNTI